MIDVRAEHAPGGDQGGVRLVDRPLARGGSRRGGYRSAVHDQNRGPRAGSVVRRVEIDGAVPLRRTGLDREDERLQEIHDPQVNREDLTMGSANRLVALSERPPERRSA
jgi:hypothetical protein